MNAGIGEGKTREDHKSVSDQLYAAYAGGRELRGLVAIVGEDALNERDLKLLKFADIFEDQFLRQSRDEDRSISEGTLDLAWDLLPKHRHEVSGQVGPEVDRQVPPH
ncbi:MAG: hypothetical protein Ct9H300mP30_3470 [Methanobacteriota archaeon]|nr:MAG: hypothetical protein Ct9H300mP30_3470 [Euryarchaeota archaeon]